MLGFMPPAPTAFHLLFQTNMKLLLQIKGESSSVIPEGLTNGRGRAPKSGRRENWSQTAPTRVCTNVQKYL